ncbi:MAG: helix-turn-helix domain-containing protein [Chryseotalea sp. WA131a]|nr:MAG: helix-turn-helix domain-containing protein [Chryseotalea sp. WA131a]
MGRLLKAGKTHEEMATAVGCHKSTISRELKRNTRNVAVRQNCTGLRRLKENKCYQSHT